MNTRVLLAVFKRNLIGYFTNPTGYVFICVFVLLSSVAAFLPYEFFSANLANLDQLNRWIPLILLVFIPAITMGMWADERRQGTDELLLTIPAGDFDIVIGKFAAAAKIFGLSLLFSMLCNYLVLSYLGNPDIGLFVTTYVGYYFLGVAMLGIGMIASFVTSNLTVAYIFGVLLNVPLIALQWMEAAPISRDVAAGLRQFSVAEQFDLFGRGILSLSHILYFVAITVVMLYVSMILIGRRHWTANQSMTSGFHYIVRTVSLLAAGLFLCMITQVIDLRADMTAEKLSTLSPRTLAFIESIDPDYPVMIDAYISPDVPKSYTQTRLDMLALLNEIKQRGGKRVAVQIHTIEPNTDESLIVNQRYQIEPREVVFSSQGVRQAKRIFLGVAMRCGLKTLTLPFIDRGLSVEYELVHALCSLIAKEKKRLGILVTEANLFGGFDMTTFSPNPSWRVVDELRKQYTVIEVNPAEPITEKFDVLLAVQPSSLGPAEMANVIETIRTGQPTVIFEDPFPIFVPNVPGTGAPKRGPSNPMMPPRNLPKGDITTLWNLLGVYFEPNWVLWQEYNPIPKLGLLQKSFVFVDQTRPDGKSNTTDETSSVDGGRADGGMTSGVGISPTDEVTNKLRLLLLAFPGTMTKDQSSSVEYTPILRTFREPVGHYLATELRRPGLRPEELSTLERSDVGQFDLAVRLRGELPAIQKPGTWPKPTTPSATLPETDVDGNPTKTPAPDEEETATVTETYRPKLDVILIADLDLIADGFFSLRERGNDPDSGIFFDFDNITLVLNTIDSLAKDDRFIALRSRRPTHRTLERFDAATRDIRHATAAANTKRTENLKKMIESATKELDDNITALRKEWTDRPEVERMIKLDTALNTAQKRLSIQIDDWQREAALDQDKADVALNEAISQTQGRYKLFAIIFPPIPPLVVALFVFFGRRIQEYEGVPKSRQRKR